MNSKYTLPWLPVELKEKTIKNLGSELPGELKDKVISYLNIQDVLVGTTDWYFIIQASLSVCFSRLDMLNMTNKAI